ncbi:glyoxalase family protein [Aliidiomarina minuta]|uniref:Glyoxalase family protein n=1 Tax=Aliidiomarina minuta TaxID=880057 RepID=A0A432W5H7_9GAMM|nr:VOC family protein [Aliidiomarina minuta]RUO25324.1 glyoxalase family protein [Aliidiomarina minuta]
MKESGKINYIEIPVRDMKASKRFFSAVFGWTFSDYGEDYSAIDNGGLDGGFYTSAMAANADNGSPLVVLYADNLDKVMQEVEQHGGNIKKPVFAFPGGKRFHFTDPSGNEYAVWSES